MAMGLLLQRSVDDLLEAFAIAFTKATGRPHNRAETARILVDELRRHL